MGEKAGKWLRVSTGMQDEANQDPDITAHIDVHGYELSRTYTLHGKSASKGEQEAELCKAIADIKAGRVTVIVAWALDRLDRRGIAESFSTKKRIEEAGGRVEFAKEPAMNDLEFAIKAYLAQQESKRRSERVRSGQDKCRVNGVALGPAPWGYEVTGPKRAKLFVPTAQGRQWVPVMFQRVADGESVTSLARWMTEHSGTKKWSAATVSALIRNSTYMGAVRDAAGNITHRPEELVDAALWTRANKSLSGGDRKRRGPNQPKALLAGILRCGECGAAVYRSKAERGVSGAYYRCSASHALQAPLLKVEAAVDKLAAKAFNAKVKITRKVEGYSHEAEIKATAFDIRALDPEMDSYMDKLTGLMSKLTELKSLPSVPDTWVTEESKTERYSDLWATLEPSERGPWLKRHGFVFWLHRDRLQMSQRGGPWEDGWVPVADQLPMVPARELTPGRVAHTVLL